MLWEVGQTFKTVDPEKVVLMFKRVKSRDYEQIRAVIAQTTGTSRCLDSRHSVRSPARFVPVERRRFSRPPHSRLPADRQHPVQPVQHWVRLVDPVVEASLDLLLTLY